MIHCQQQQQRLQAQIVVFASQRLAIARLYSEQQQHVDKPMTESHPQPQQPPAVEQRIPDTVDQPRPEPQQQSSLVCC